MSFELRSQFASIHSQLAYYTSLVCHYIVLQSVYHQPRTCAARYPSSRNSKAKSRQGAEDERSAARLPDALVVLKRTEKMSRKEEIVNGTTTCILAAGLDAAKVIPGSAAEGKMGKRGQMGGKGGGVDRRPSVRKVSQQDMITATPYIDSSVINGALVILHLQMDSRRLRSNTITQ